MGDAPVTVDDYDPRINYSGHWSTGGSYNEHAESTHWAHNSGAMASFVFNGTSVAVYGTIEPRRFMNAPPPVSTYSVDGSNSYTFAPTPGNTLLYKQLFYKVSNLPAGEHTLVITLQRETSRFWLDYLEYTPNSCSVIPTTSGAVIESSISTSWLSRVTLGPVVYGAVGGVALSFLAFFLVWLWRQRRKAPRSGYNALAQSDANSQRPAYLAAVIPLSIRQSSLASTANFVTPQTRAPSGRMGGQSSGNFPSRNWDPNEPQLQRIGGVPPPNYQDQCALVDLGKSSYNIPPQRQGTSSFPSEIEGEHPPAYINEPNVP